MGQTKKGGTPRKIRVATRLKSGKYPMIVLPRDLLDEICGEAGTNILRLHIENDVKTEYIWEYDPNKKPYLVFKELEEGEYDITIEPYTLKDFLREFNAKADEHGLRLTVRHGVLTTHIKNQGEISTENWRFEKEHGGAIHILAEYPAPARHEEKAIIKYQLKRGEPSIYLLEKQGERRRLSPHKITEIKILGNHAIIHYTHGKKTKTTRIQLTTQKTQQEQTPRQTTPIQITATNLIKTQKHHIERHEYKITDEQLANELRELLVNSYKALRMGDRGTFNSNRELVGLRIATEYLKYIGFEEDTIYQSRAPSPIMDKITRIMKIIMGPLKPDIAILNKEEIVTVEAKFRVSERRARADLDGAARQALRYLEATTRNLGKIPKDLLSRRIKRVRTILLMIGYDYKTGMGYILHWEEKRGEG